MNILDNLKAKNREELYGCILRDGERRSGHRKRLPSKNAPKQPKANCHDLAQGEKVIRALQIEWA